MSEMSTRPVRKRRNYLKRVESDLRAIYLTAREYTDDDADITPSIMIEIMRSAKRALRELGYAPSRPDVLDRAIAATAPDGV